MARFKLFSVFLLLIQIACTPSVEWVSSTRDAMWVKEQPIRLNKKIDQCDVQIDVTQELQAIEGFGGCFNELGWLALSRLDPAARDSVFNELFLPGFGANFNLCRMPVGANDFSSDWYSYDETEGDFEMENFSITNDMKTLIPFIHFAQQKNPSLKIWASPWSPPSWMKWNKHYACRVPWEELDEKFHNNLPLDRQGAEGTNMFIQEDEYFNAYALYFSKFIEAYRNEDIMISTIMPQNEFNSCQIFPSCTWTAEGLTNFIGNYLGPAMEERKVEIMFGTMERPTVALVDTVLNDPVAAKYIQGIGFQWAGKEAIPRVHQKYPDLKLYQTEQECGDGKNDWEYCQYAWRLMKHYFNNGISAYMYRNIALEEGGFSRWGWQQNSLVTVDTLANTYHYNYEYYLIKHVSHYVMPGAKMVKTYGDFEDLLAFKNPDNTLVLVIRSDEEKELKVKIGTKYILPKLKAGSFNTLIIKE